jgi:hypothetical protein
VLVDELHQILHPTLQNCYLSFEYLVPSPHISRCFDKIFLLLFLFASTFACSFAILLKIDSSRRARFRIFRTSSSTDLRL